MGNPLVELGRRIMDGFGERLGAPTTRDRGVSPRLAGGEDGAPAVDPELAVRVSRGCFALTGLPRSGTTYLSAVLYHPPDVITVSDPEGLWQDVYEEHGLGPRALEVLADYRARVADGSEIPTLAGTAGFRGTSRVDTWNQKKHRRSVRTRQGFRLGMKNPLVFLQLLEIFGRADLKCVITVRHPVAVINSWVRMGENRLTEGRSLDGSFANGHSLLFRSELDDIVDRRIDLHNYFAGRILAHRDAPDTLIIRYEDWAADERQLEKVAAFLDVPCRDHLQPAFIQPRPPVLSEGEKRRILDRCPMAREFGYGMSPDGRLTMDGRLIEAGS